MPLPFPLFLSYSSALLGSSVLFLDLPPILGYPAFALGVFLQLHVLPSCPLSLLVLPLTLLPLAAMIRGFKSSGWGAAATLRRGTLEPTKLLCVAMGTLLMIGASPRDTLQEDMSYQENSSHAVEHPLELLWNARVYLLSLAVLLGLLHKIMSRFSAHSGWSYFSTMSSSSATRSTWPPRDLLCFTAALWNGGFLLGMKVMSHWIPGDFWVAPLGILGVCGASLACFGMLVRSLSLAVSLFEEGCASRYLFYSILVVFMNAGVVLRELDGIEGWGGGGFWVFAVGVGATLVGCV